MHCLPCSARAGRSVTRTSLDNPLSEPHTSRTVPFVVPALVPQTLIEVVLLADSTTSRVSLTLSSSLASVDQAERAAEEYAERVGFDEDARGNIAMAVREAVVNAVLHGNAYDANKHVTVSFETTTDDLLVKVADQGAGLDPDTIPDPLAPENILRGSGRGIFLIRAFMDEVNFRQTHPGTELTLIKHRTPA